MYLERLRNWDVQFSWGSAALTYLYRQLDQAPMRTKDSSSLCGFVWRLFVWMWERLPVGRPMLKNPDHPKPIHMKAFIMKIHIVARQLPIIGIRERERFIENEERPHNDSAYQEYLVWYAEHYRLKLKPGWTREEWSELVSEDPSAVEGYHAFNMVVREIGGSQVDYAPMHDELGREFLLCVNDVNVALSHPPGGASSERTLRTALEKFRSRFHKWAAMLSCHGAQSVDVFTGGTSRSSRARRREMTIDDIEEEEEEEIAQDHEVDIDAPQPSHSCNNRHSPGRRRHHVR
ncbi:hypothetical protein D1007_18574 [Hordeum vulgare]|nr:hypothetical protein D1007_18574 [Hordeum vulgare]